MPYTYKRRSRFWWTFSTPRLGQFFQKRGFFNSHARLQQTVRLPLPETQIGTIGVMEEELHYAIRRNRRWFHVDSLGV
jgi:hypothetical protein